MQQFWNECYDIRGYSNLLSFRILQLVIPILQMHTFVVGMAQGLKFMSSNIFFEKYITFLDVNNLWSVQ
jgi:uncharacterized membrane protein YhaH (DUF805 family)